MAFRKKAKYLLKYTPAIVVVPECENIDRLLFDKGSLLPSDILWYGTNHHKGIGVFSYSDYTFKLLDCHNPALKYVLPIAVTGGEIDFILFAIWANNAEDKDGQYVTQVWKALHYYEELLSEKNIFLMGDFNSNTIWDRPRRAGNHSSVVEKLASKNIFSTYHFFHNQVQGKEKHPTHFLYRHKDKPYHLDYCFASQALIEKLENVEIGKHKDWVAYSDHSPVIVKFKL
jgi:exonuclease III